MTDRFAGDLFPWEDEAAAGAPAQERERTEQHDAGDEADVQPAGPPAAAARTDLAGPESAQSDEGPAEGVAATVPPDNENSATAAPDTAPADEAPADEASADQASAHEASDRGAGPSQSDSGPGEASDAADSAGLAGGSNRGQGGRSEAAARPLVRKEYYSISEVSDLVGLPAHVLRYWESQFSVLNPSKNRSGNRVYQRKEIKLILLVKQLLHEEKYTVEGAKQKLDQLRRGGAIHDATARALDEQLVRVLREDLLALSELLQLEGE